jgi:hypothetical protein
VESGISRPSVEKQKMQKKAEHRHLLRSKMFWSAFLSPLAVSVILAIIISANTDLGSVCLSSECVQVFFNHFKFPFAIAGLALPLVAMAAAIHRSMEAALQIDLANRQFGEAVKNNRFGNYYKHREGFEKFIESHCAKRNYGGQSKGFVLTVPFYGKVFPDASFNNDHWNGEYSQKAIDMLDKHAKNIVDQIGRSDKDFDCSSFMTSARFLIGYIGLNFSPSRPVRFKTKKGDTKVFYVPKMKGGSGSIFSAVRDVLGIYVVLRGYIGLNNSSGLSIGSEFDKVSALLKAHSESFETP